MMRSQQNSKKTRINIFWDTLGLSYQISRYVGIGMYVCTYFKEHISLPQLSKSSSDYARITNNANGENINSATKMEQTT